MMRGLLRIVWAEYRKLEGTSTGIILSTHVLDYVPRRLNPAGAKAGAKTKKRLMARRSTERECGTSGEGETYYEKLPCHFAFAIPHQYCSYVTVLYLKFTLTKII